MDDRTPVLTGVGQFTYCGDPGGSPSLTALLKIAADRVADDAGWPRRPSRRAESIGPSHDGQKNLFICD